MVAIGFLLVGERRPGLAAGATRSAGAGLWIAAVLTLVTGWDYLQAGAAPHAGGRAAPARPQAGEARLRSSGPEGVPRCGSATSPGSSSASAAPRRSSTRRPRWPPSQALKALAGRPPPGLCRGAGRPGRGALRRQPGVRAERRTPLRPGRRGGLLPAGDRRLTGLVRVQAEPFDPGPSSAPSRAAAPTSAASPASSASCATSMAASASSAMTLEHYPGMTERKLAEIEAEARRPLAAAGQRSSSIAIGRMLPGEPIVLVATAVGPPPRRARRLRLPDRLAEDRGAVLEARGDRRRRALGRGPRERRPGGGALGAPGAVTGRRQPSARLASTKSRKARTLAGGRWREGW